MVVVSIHSVGIHWNSSKPTGLDFARNLVDILLRRKVRVTVNLSLAIAIGRPELNVDDFQNCQLLIVLGGDGTILSAMDRAIPNDIPVLGINLGRLGFLTELETSNFDESVIDRVLAGDFIIDERMTMQIEGHDNDKVFALNEIVIARSTPSVRVLSLEYEADGTLVDRISGDGLIVATATGSTAYSLSAGGPVVLPGLDCFLLTPVCPHTLNARPVVVSSALKITVRMVDDRGGAQAVLDGRKIIPLSQGNQGITISKSDRTVKFVRLQEKNYFGLLRSKLSEWTH